MVIIFYKIAQKENNKCTLIKKFNIKGSDVTANTIAQNKKGNVFCVPYLDAGHFWILVFSKEKEFARTDLSVMLGIDDSTRPIFGISNPMIFATFGHSTYQLFFNLLHRNTMQHYHGNYDYVQKSLVGETVIVPMDSFKGNFPQETFYDDKR